MDSAKLLFMSGIMIGLYLTVAIVYVIWAIASFQWWLLIFAVIWAGLGLLIIRTAKKNFELMQVELDLARSEGMIDAYIDRYYGGSGDKSPEQLADEADKA